MSLFRRKRRGGSSRRESAVDLSHLEEFAKTRRGVEGYVEPKTAVTEMTLVLVAADGEWTRRRISGPDSAREFGRRLALPIYDVAAVGYPKRMREWTARRKANEGRPTDPGGLNSPGPTS